MCNTLPMRCHQWFSIELLARRCRVEFTWTDEKGKKVKGLTAPQYIDYVCSHMQSVLDDDTVFPTSVGMVFMIRGAFYGSCKRGPISVVFYSGV